VKRVAGIGVLLAIAAAISRAHQDAPTAKSEPAYTAAEFNADAKKVSQAMATSAERRSRHEFDAAIDALDEALKEIRPKTLQATLWISKADVHQVLGRLSSAQADLDAAERLLASLDAKTRKKERSTQLDCYLCCQRSHLYLKWGLIDLAHDWIGRAKALLPAPTAGGAGNGDPKPSQNFDSERIYTHYVEALVLASMDDYAALETSVNAAIQDEVYAKFPFYKSRLLARLGMGWKENRRFQPADGVRARPLLEKVLADPEFQGIDRCLPELALAELALSVSDWAEAEARITSAAGSLGPADVRAKLPNYFAWLALSAQLLVERKDRPATQADLEGMRVQLEKALQDRIEEWGHRDLRPGGYGHLLYRDQLSLVSELMRLDLSLEKAGEERALSRILSAGATGTLARKLAASAASLSDVRAQLLGASKEHAILVYFPAPDRTHLFVVDHASTQHFLLPARDFIEAARYEAEKTLQRPVQGSAREMQVNDREKALADLCRLVLPPEVLARLKGRTLWTIVGEDLLGPVPFEALVPEGACLGTTHAISHLPSLAVGLRLAERARREARTSASAGTPVALLLSAPLGKDRELADAELEEILKVYPSKAMELASGPKADFATLRRVFPAVRVAHVFAHGRYDERRERPAGMLLASPQGEEAGFVGSDEVELLDAPPLVVLTVCGAARAPKRRGDASAADLAGAFLSAGERARCVIQTSYDLDVDSARQLSIAFHAALVAGDSPAEALRKARVSLARNPLFADPFHYALIGVVGLGHEPIFVR
jgi:hypothetical protein